LILRHFHAISPLFRRRQLSSPTLFLYFHAFFARLIAGLRHFATITLFSCAIAAIFFDDSFLS
jgi:hypothetical protein